MKKIPLPSGVELGFQLAPFEDADNLQMVVAEEMRAANMDPDKEIDANFYKDLALIAVSSRKIRAALEPCIHRCTYAGERIVNIKQTFESEKAREDYLTILWEVAQENLRPFVKTHFAKFRKVLGVVEDLK